MAYLAPGNQGDIMSGIIDQLINFTQVQLSQDKSTITIGGGCLWSEVYPVCDAAGVSVVGGGSHFVGVGGYFTQAGWSWLVGHHGYACDNVLGATVVVPGDAEGDGVRTVQCGPYFASSSNTSAEEEYADDLFWAIRGAGANFGIVTEFVVKTHPHVGGHLSGTLHYKGEDLTAVMDVIKESKPLRSNDESIYLGFDCDPHGNPEVFVLVWIRAESPEKTKQNPVMSPFWTAVKVNMTIQKAIDRDSNSSIPTQPTMDNTVFCTTHEQTSHVGDYAEMHSPPRIDGRGWNFPVELFVEDPDFVPTLWAKFVSIAATPGFGKSLFFFECHDLRRAAQPALLAAASFPAAGRRPHIGLLAACKYDAARDDDKADAMVRDVLDYVREAGCVRGMEMLGHPSFLCNGDERLEDVYMSQLPRLR
ncbi:hypothetical protein SLS64_007501 [Diaporthe eres]